MLFQYALNASKAGRTVVFVRPASQRMECPLLPRYFEPHAVENKDALARIRMIYADDHRSLQRYILEFDEHVQCSHAVLLIVDGWLELFQACVAAHRVARMPAHYKTSCAAKGRPPSARVLRRHAPPSRSCVLHPCPRVDAATSTCVDERKPGFSRCFAVYCSSVPSPAHTRTRTTTQKCTCRHRLPYKFNFLVSTFLLELVVLRADLLFVRAVLCRLLPISAKR